MNLVSSDLNKYWEIEQSSDVVLKVVTFLLTPFLGFLVALRRINTKSSFVIFFLFSVFFGLNFNTSSGRDETHTGDASQYRMFFEYDKNMTSGELRDIFNVYSSFQDEMTRDLYVPLMSFLTAKISDSYHVFFALLACVFAFFMLKSFKFISVELPRNNIYILIILYLFALSNSIFNINGCRFWTSAWVAVYSMFQIFRNGNKRYFLLAAITPMIHASYWFFLFVLLIAYFFGKGLHFWKIVFFLSFILSSLSTQILVDLSDYLPASLQFLVDRYTDNDIEVKSNLYQIIHRIFDFARTVVLAYMMFLFMKHEKNIMNNPKINRLYPLLLVWMTICNFVMPIPSLGKRFIVLGYPILAYIWYIIFEKNQKYRRVLLIYPFAGLMGIYELIMCYLHFSVPLSFYYTSPLYQIYKYIILGVI